MHTLPEKIGIVNELIAYMQNPDNQTALKAKNFDPTPHIARLQGKLKSMGDLSTAQKLLEVQKQNKTAEAQTAAYDAYNDASGTLDAMIGLLGKGTGEAASSRPSAAACATTTPPLLPLRPRRSSRKSLIRK